VLLAWLRARTVWACCARSPHKDGVNLHDGTLPTAMEFFRWRLVEAPATPTQATVYRLFPGGWPAVLTAYEASADRA
jgi:hypothetical protein